MLQCPFGLERKKRKRTGKSARSSFTSLRYWTIREEHDTVLQKWQQKNEKRIHILFTTMISNSKGRIPSLLILQSDNLIFTTDYTTTLRFSWERRLQRPGGNTGITKSQWLLGDKEEEGTSERTDKFDEEMHYEFIFLDVFVERDEDFRRNSFERNEASMNHVHASS